MDVLQRKLHQHILIRLKEWRPADQKIYYSDITKASLRFDWRPLVKVGECVDRSLKWELLRRRARTRRPSRSASNRIRATRAMPVDTHICE
jgi:UDP-glucose 4-epimerase